MDNHKIKIHTMEQGTPEWFEVRKLKMTASHADAVANGKKVHKTTKVESIGAGLKTYAKELVADKYSSGEFEHYENEHIKRGNELEPQAIAVYQLKTGCIVKPVGFVEIVGQPVGCSPDGDIFDEEGGETDGMLEVKCKSDKNHVAQLIGGESEIESKYIWQMQYQMFVYKKKWCDFMAFNPNFKKSTFIHRVMRDEDMIAKIKEGIAIGSKLIEEYEAKVKPAK